MLDFHLYCQKEDETKDGKSPLRRNNGTKLRLTNQLGNNPVTSSMNATETLQQ